MRKKCNQLKVLHSKWTLIHKPTKVSCWFITSCWTSHTFYSALRQVTTVLPTISNFTGHLLTVSVPSSAHKNVVGGSLFPPPSSPLPSSSLYISDVNFSSIFCSKVCTSHITTQLSQGAYSWNNIFNSWRSSHYTVSKHQMPINHPVMWCCIPEEWIPQLHQCESMCVFAYV